MALPAPAALQHIHIDLYCRKKSVIDRVKLHCHWHPLQLLHGSVAAKAWTLYLWFDSTSSICVNLTSVIALHSWCHRA